MLQHNEWHLKHMPVLTYVSDFTFITPLSMEKCSERLANAASEKPQRMKTNIHEVSRESDSSVVFAAKYATNQSAWYLAGHIHSTGQQNQVRCYSGLPILTLIPPFIILVVILSLVGITNHLSLIALIGLFIAILVVVGLVSIRYVRLFRQALERDIHKLLS